MPTEIASPYLMDEPPTSTSRVLLSRSFSHWCILHHGYSDHDVYVALDPEKLCDDIDQITLFSSRRLKVRTRRNLTLAYAGPSVPQASLFLTFSS
jgi:hypothetical protein